MKKQSTLLANIGLTLAAIVSIGLSVMLYTIRQASVDYGAGHFKEQSTSMQTYAVKTVMSVDGYRQSTAEVMAYGAQAFVWLVLNAIVAVLTVLNLFSLSDKRGWNYDRIFVFALLCWNVFLLYQLSLLSTDNLWNIQQYF